MKAKVSDVELQAFHVYLPYGGRFNLENSLVNGGARYLFSSRAGKIAEHSLNANLTIGGFGLLAERSAQPIVVVSGLQASDVRMDFLTSKAAVGSLTLENLDLRVEGSDNDWNLIVQVDEAGRVVLDGELPQLDLIRKAIEAAVKVAGVQRLDSNLEIEPRHYRPYYPSPYGRTRLGGTNIAAGSPYVAL